MKTKYPVEMRIKAGQDYDLGIRPILIRKRISSTIDKKRLQYWVRQYHKYGDDPANWPAFGSYPRALKLRAVKAYLTGTDSLLTVALAFDLSCYTLLRDWLSLYNEDKTCFDPRKETRIMPNRQKTTQEERLAIVQYYLTGHTSLRQTAEDFQVSKSQVQYWVRRYKESGEDGLRDRRGHHKEWNELSRQEQDRRVIERLKKALAKKQAEIDFLKKLSEMEGEW